MAQVDLNKVSKALALRWVNGCKATCLKHDSDTVCDMPPAARGSVVVTKALINLLDDNNATTTDNIIVQASDLFNRKGIKLIGHLKAFEVSQINFYSGDTISLDI